MNPRAPRASGTLFVLLGLPALLTVCAETSSDRSPPSPARLQVEASPRTACQASAPAPDAPPVDEPETTRRERPSHAGDLCETADSNLARATTHILTDPGGPLRAPAPWDHKTAPERMTRVARRLSLGAGDRAVLDRGGFVVLPGHTASSYAYAFHEIFQSELPVWIGVDAILDAVFASNDHLIADLERGELSPLLERTLRVMHCALPDAPYSAETRHDLDLYLTVARSLLADAPVPSIAGTDAEAAVIATQIKRAEGISEVSVFGRSRVVDWSAYLPRGHYAEAEAPSPLGPYFRAAMFASRFEWNVVSRSSRSSMFGDPDPRETPREAVDALAVADLVARAGATGGLGRIERLLTLLAGRREDLSVPDLLALEKKAGLAAVDGAAFEPLKAAIGAGFVRTARLHPMPEGATDLPVIATLLGPRVVADASAFRPLLHSEVPERRLVLPGDVAYVLGLDRGEAWLADDLARFPALPAALDRARALLAGAPDAGDLYGAWLGAVRAVAEAPRGVTPSFMQGKAYDDLRMNTMIAGYGQLRHSYVLLAGQAYDEGGCEIPDAWVEPLPAVYDAVAAYAARGARVMKEIDPDDRQKTRDYFARLETTARVLSVIARHELEGRALTADERRYLSMVAEMTPGSTGASPTYTGWYFNLFRQRETEALAGAGFVADYQTSAWTQRIEYAGATSPRLGVFVVDTGGPPRLMVGPVARAYGLTGPTDARFTDETAADAPGKQDPWAASYTGPLLPPPEVAAVAEFAGEQRSRAVTRILLRAPRTIERALVEILDHHGDPVATFTPRLPAGEKVVLTTKAVGEGLRVRVGDRHAEGWTTSMEPDAVVASGLSVDDTAGK